MGPGQRPTDGIDRNDLGSAQPLADAQSDPSASSERVRVRATGLAEVTQTAQVELPSSRHHSPPRVHIAASTSISSTNPVRARMALAQEFRTLASLRHLHIISVLDYG